MKKKLRLAKETLRQLELVKDPALVKGGAPDTMSGTDCLPTGWYGPVCQSVYPNCWDTQRPCPY